MTPLRRRAASLVRTGAFRTALLYLGLHTATVLAILGSLWWSATGTVEEQAQDLVEAELRGLAEQYRTQGLFRLIDVIGERTGPTGDPDSVYLLVDAFAQPLAGNLIGWPAATPVPSGWMELSVVRTRGGVPRPVPVQARGVALPGGMRLLVGHDLTELTRLQQTLAGALLWGLAGAAVIGVAGAVLLGLRTLRRIERVAGVTDAIVAGAWGRRLESSARGDELDRLAASVNAMLDRLERLMTGMRLATDALAHDMRSPLTRLRVRIEAALRRPADVEEDRAALADALAQAEAAIAIFEDLLQIAQAEAGGDPASLTPLDLSALARDAVELYAPVAEERGLTLTVAAPDDPVAVRGHPQLLTRALANLLDNALAFTPPGGAIAVTVAVAPEAGPRLLVRDTGPGIPEAQRGRVLERFVRLDPSRSRPGAGLGLSLVAAVARLHGAALALDDAGPGLLVTLAFPARPAMCDA